MSAVYWRTRSGEDATLRGPERAWCGSISGMLAEMVVPTRYLGAEEHPLSRLVVEDGVRQSLTLGPVSDGFTSDDRERHQNRESNLRLYLGFGMADWHIKWRPTETSDPIKSNAWHLGLNTAIASGSPTYAFMARLHAQCEIHMWVAQENRAWLADLIDNSLKQNILRKALHRKDLDGTYAKPESMGWEKIVTLLRSEVPGPVVTDFSGTDSFPSPPPDWEPKHQGPDEGHRYEAFYALDFEEQWDLVFAHLSPTLEVTPENLTEQGFGDGYSWYDVMASPSWREA